jgi:putative glycerol-1-phosphate prenyltransferase
MSIYKTILAKKAKHQKQFALLIDPDKTDAAKLNLLLKTAQKSAADYIFIGGSFLTNDSFCNCVRFVKDSCDIPVILFPGSNLQICHDADAILFLSLISGRNPEMLIGNHVIAAPYLQKSPIEIISTGYLLIDSGRTTTAVYMSNTTPIPYEKDDIAGYTALAGEMLGMKMIYADAGSGALKPVSESMISSVSKNISIPLIAGGGIRTPEQAVKACKAGADIIVVGNAIEKNSKLITSISAAIHKI